jgi:hypothetical protein
MKSKIFLFLVLHIFVYQISNSQEINILFDFNSDVLRINDYGKLYNLVEEYKLNEFRVQLIGHTDTVGNSDYNLQLSKRRVESIKNHLVKNGINSDNILTDFKGESYAINSEQFYNRRVEIYIERKAKIQTYNDFLTSIKPIKQVFNVPLKSEIILEGEKGTIIRIPEGAFNCSYENGNDSVKIELQEYYSLLDFISDRLSTVSNGNLLTSGGMVNIEVFKEDNKISLKNGVDIELEFPKLSDKRYYTFYGERTENGGMNWVSDKRQVAISNKQEEYGATIGLDGESLMVVGKEEADERNRKIQFNPLTERFGILTEAEKEKIEKYYQEQERIEQQKEKYYNLLKASRLNYINCDEYIRDPSSTVIVYQVDIENTDIELTSAYLVFKNTNSVIELSRLADLTFGISARLPLNENVELMVTGMKDLTLYLYKERTILKKETLEMVKLQESDYETIRKSLR